MCFFDDAIRVHSELVKAVVASVFTRDLKSIFVFLLAEEM